MSFLHPSWLLLGLILPLILLGAILCSRSQGDSWRQLVAARLRSHLVKQAPQTRRWISLALGLLGCALLTLVIARPYSGKTTTTEEIRTRNILIAVDTSRSMLAGDGSPDRMATAKTMALEITASFPNDRIGIIAFSGTSVLLAPLTVDHASIRDTIGQLDTEIIPSGGSNLASAAEIAVETFKKIGHSSNALVIISDGEDHSQAIDDVAQGIRDNKLAVSTVAVGTKDGSMIPDPRQPDGKYRDIKGNPVHSQMIPDALVALAKAGGGSFVEATSDAPDAVRESFEFLQSNQQEGRQISLPNERYPWFLIPAILCFIASMVTRSHIFNSSKPAPVAACLVCLFTLLPLPHTHAATDLEQANQAYKNKNYAVALKSFEKALRQSQGEDRHNIQFSAGSTAYRLKNWPQASRYFSASLLSSQKNLRESSHYNLGNTLFQSAWSLFKPAENPNGEETGNTVSYEISDPPTAITLLEDAISHYQAALDLNEQHEDARHNQKEAENLLKQLKEQQQEEQNAPQQDKGEQPKEKGDQPNESPDQEQKGDQQGKNPDQKDQDQPDQRNDEESDQEKQSEQTDKEHEQQPGESDEAYAARILKETSDAETRPVKSRFLRMRRPAKDW